jgi:hypothetical protein
MTKYNNYAGVGTGNGQNEIAILDPNATENDPIDGASVQVMKEVLTILGPTPDSSNDQQYPGAVREWCINDAAVDPFTDSVLANSEDGNLYRWNLSTNTFTQVVTLSSGRGEAYTPTLIGKNGLVYAIQNSTLFAVGMPTGTQPVIVVDGQPGYSDSGNWHSETDPADYDGTDRWASASGNGNSTATWTVSGLPAGLYTVQVAWAGHSSYATNAPYAIYDGSTLLQTVPVNESQAPTGTSYGGVPFQQIATVAINSGTINVVLSNTGTNNTYIIANAVRIAPVPSSNTDLNWAASGDGITGPGSATTQSTFNVNWTYTVSGATAPSSFTIAYYASTSSNPNQNFNNAISLGAQTISNSSSWTVGDHSGTSPAFNIPTNGSYYLFALLNAHDDFAETNMNNNLTETSSPMVVSGPVIVANGQSGYSDSGNWHSESDPADYGGTDRWASASGNGNNTATWTVSGLPAGLYNVQVAWAGHSSYASNAPYAIYDGSTLLQTVAVNESQAPVGASYGGVPFQQIATVTINSGTINVVLSNTGTNNTYIIANAVRVAPVPPSNTDLNWTDSGDGITGPASTSTQSTFTIGWTYTISTGPAPSSFAITYYASTSSNPNQNFSQAIDLGSQTISSAGLLTVGDHTGTSPAFQIVTNGTYYLFALLNSNPDFIETNMNNNLVVSSAPTVVSGPVIIAAGQAGYSDSGNWHTESDPADYDGTDRWASSSGNGNSTATWTFTGLPPGQYTVQVAWAGHSSYASNAPYALYDGSTLLQTVSVNESQAPQGTDYGGVPFQQIATVTIDSGTLTVVLSNTGTNNAYIIANAVRIAPA